MTDLDMFDDGDPIEPSPASMPAAKPAKPVKPIDPPAQPATPAPAVTRQAATLNSTEQGAFDLGVTPAATPVRRARKAVAPTPSSPQPSPAAPARVSEMLETQSPKDVSKSAPKAAPQQAPATKTSGSGTKALAAAGVVLAVLALWFFARPTSAEDAPAAEAALPAAAVPADAAQTSLTEDLARANDHRSTTGSFRGFAPTAPAAAAVGKDVIVLVMPTGEGCFYTGVAPGFDSAVHLDESGSKCEMGVLPTLQAELDANDSAVDSASNEAASSRLAASATTVQYWASRGDLSSLIGSSVGEGVMVSGPALGGEAVVLVTTASPGSCMSLTVSATGYTEPAPTEC